MRRRIRPWLANIFGQPCKASARRSTKSGRRFNLGTYTRRNRFEPLEDRRLLATFSVNSPDDTDISGTDNSATLSLREAIAVVNTPSLYASLSATEKSRITGTIGSQDNITFSGVSSISLSSLGSLYISKNLSITGPGAGQLTIHAYNPTPTQNNGDGRRMFNIDDFNPTTNILVTFSGLTLTGGDLANDVGGATIRSYESLSLQNSIISDSFSGSFAAPGGTGGAVYSRLRYGASLTITNTVVTGNRGTLGGGIHVRSGNDGSSTIETITIADSVFLNNTSTGRGGGLSIAGGDDLVLNMSKTEFHANQAQNGGGMFIVAGHRSEISISDSTISGNTAVSTGSSKTGDGGGLELHLPGTFHDAAIDATFTLARSIVKGNHATNRGGGMYFNIGAGSNAIISQSTITGNDAGLKLLGVQNSVTRNPNSGGGLYAYIFSGDDDYGAPIPANEKARLTISGSTIDTNRAGRHGGGVFIFSKREDFTDAVHSEVSIFNSTISGNSADSSANPQPGYRGYGGGVHIAFFQAPTDVEGLDVRFHNVTLTGNNAYKGGGIYSLVPTQINKSNDVRLNNTIASGNTIKSASANDGKNLFGSFNPIESRNNLLGDNVIDADPNNLIFSPTGSAASNFTTANGNLANLSNDPLLNPLAYNGGLTKTHLPRNNSPAIDSGNAAWDVEPFGGPDLTTDQRGTGYSRAVNTLGITGTAGPVDIGAAEYTGTIVVTVANDEDDGSYTSWGDISLREALVIASITPGDDTITFADSLFTGGTATLSVSSVLTINSNVTLSGQGANVLSITGGNSTRVFTVNSGRTATIRDLTIKNGNASTSDGGGIYTSGNLTLERVAVESNSAIRGGGIYAFAGILTVNSSTISSNIGHMSGGGIYLATAVNASINNSTISTNTSNYQGGGIFDGSAPTGAGGPAAYVRNSTVTANNSGAGGGIYGSTVSGGTLLFNTIVANNLPWQGATRDIDGRFFSFSVANLIGYDSVLYSNGIYNGNYSNQVGGENGAPAIDPRLAGLGYFGGRTRTHALLNGSPAIDRGNNGVAISNAIFDQRGNGFDRIADGDNILLKTIDIGSFEFAIPRSGTSIEVSTLVDQLDDGNYAPGFLSIREALAMAAASPDHDTITFDPNLFGTTQASLTLVHGRLVTSNVTIIGPGADLLAINGNNLTGLFAIPVTRTTVLRDMTLKNGNSPLGAGIDSHGDLTLDGVSLEYNHGEFVGGINSSGPSLTIIDSLIANNTSSSGISGLFVGSATTKIVNSTISSNISNLGTGGVQFTGGNVELIHVTVTQNRGTTGGMMIYSANVIAHNSIIAENYLTNGTTPSDIDGVLNPISSYNLLGRGGSGFIIDLRNPSEPNHNILLEMRPGVTAGLTTLASHGGRTRTHALRSISLAIDAGDNAVATAYMLLEDQRGGNRKVDWDNIGGQRVDMGAVELAFGEMYA